MSKINKGGPGSGRKKSEIDKILDRFNFYDMPEEMKQRYKQRGWYPKHLEEKLPERIKKFIKKQNKLMSCKKSKSSSLIEEIPRQLTPKGPGYHSPEDIQSDISEAKRISSKIIGK